MPDTMTITLPDGDVPPLSEVTVEDRLARIEAMLIGAWAAANCGSIFNGRPNNHDAISELIGFARNDLRALYEALESTQLLNMTCGLEPSHA